MPLDYFPAFIADVKNRTETAMTAEPMSGRCAGSSLDAQAKAVRIGAKR